MYVMCVAQSVLLPNKVG